MTFKVGDMVKNKHGVFPHMKKGEVMYVSESVVVVRCVESGGSAFEGTDYSCRNEEHISKNFFEPYEPCEPPKKEYIAVNTETEQYIIYRDGSRTVAKDKKRNRTAEARCSPEDTYDFFEGAKIAMERLGMQRVKDEKGNLCLYKKGVLIPQYRPLEDLSADK